jgi:hypothetical protein
MKPNERPPHDKKPGLKRDNEEPGEDGQISDVEAGDISGGEGSIISPRDPQSGLPTGQRMH